MNNLPKGWRIVEWNEVLTIKNGKNQKSVIDDNGIYPIYGSGGIMGYANDFICNEKTTIIGRKGSINNPIYVTTKFWNVDTAFGICAGKDIDNKFLHYFCVRYDFKKHNKSTTLPSLTKTDLLKIQIPLPPLSEQTRIVSKLDALFARIDKSIALLEENIKHTKALIDSSIAGIFDQLGNEYQISPLLKYVDFIGGSQPPKSKFSNVSKEGYVRLIQIRDYKSNDYIVYIDKKSTTKFCTEEDVMIGRYGPPVFQILRGLIGAYNVALMKAVPNEEKLTKDYLYYFLQNSKIQSYIISISQRSAGQSGVNKKALELYEIAVPPLSVQKVVVTKIKFLIDALNKLIDEQQSKLTYLKALKSSLLDRAFKGEL